MDTDGGWRVGQVGGCGSVAEIRRVLKGIRVLGATRGGRNFAVAASRLLVGGAAY
jgi:hypothetical protein